MSNKVSGKVLLQETGVGIQDLLIEVYDVDPKTEPEIMVKLSPENPNFMASSPDFWQNFSGDLSTLGGRLFSHFFSFRLNQ